MMKNKTIIASALLISLLIGGIVLNFTLSPDLVTRILPAEYDIHIEGYTGHSEFYFSIEVEIWNPNPFFVTFLTAYYDLFDPGVRIHFDNQTLTYYAISIELTAVKRHFIKPGLTIRPYHVHVGFSVINASALPHGEYEFWGQINTGFNILRTLKLFLAVNSSGYFYSYEKLPYDWGGMRIFNSNWGIILFSIIQATILLVSYKRKDKNKDN